MTPKEKSEYFIKELGKEGAKRQAMDEIHNSDTEQERDYYYEVLDILNN